MTITRQSSRCALAAILLLTAGIHAQAANNAQRESKQLVRLMSAEKDQRLRKQLPAVNDVQIQRILDDEALLLYTDEEMPPAFQDWGSGLPGIHSPSYNISANGSEPFGNGNREFPWNVTGGTHRTSNVSTFRFLWLPTDEVGNRLPMVWYRSYQAGDSQSGYAWLYPVGTVFGEVLLMKAPDGRQVAFELRVRIRELGDWAVDVYRPFRSPQEFANHVKRERPEWEANESLAKVVAHLESPRAMKKHQLADKHPHVTFKASAGVDILPAVGDDQLITKLLSETTFKSVLGETWRKDDKGVRAFAPTTFASYHIVPAKFDAGFIEITSTSCMRCHETVNQHVNNFDFGRDWYGHIRGSDGIFSFHPFDPSCISHNGFGNGVRMNAKLEQAGLLAPFNSAEHPPTLYQQVRNLD